MNKYFFVGTVLLTLLLGGTTGATEPSNKTGTQGVQQVFVGGCCTSIGKCVMTSPIPFGAACICIFNGGSASGAGCFL